MTPKTLDCDSGKCDSQFATTEKGFHDGDVWGPFSFAAPLVCSFFPFRLCLVEVGVMDFFYSGDQILYEIVRY